MSSTGTAAAPPPRDERRSARSGAGWPRGPTSRQTPRCDGWPPPTRRGPPHGGTTRCRPRPPQFGERAPFDGSRSTRCNSVSRSRSSSSRSMRCPRPLPQCLQAGGDRLDGHGGDEEDEVGVGQATEQVADWRQSGGDRPRTDQRPGSALLAEHGTELGHDAEQIAVVPDARWREVGQSSSSSSGAPVAVARATNRPAWAATARHWSASASCRRPPAVDDEAVGSRIAEEAVNSSSSACRPTSSPAVQGSAWLAAERAQPRTEHYRGLVGERTEQGARPQHRWARCYGRRHGRGGTRRRARQEHAAAAVAVPPGETARPSQSARRTGARRRRASGRPRPAAGGQPGRRGRRRQAPDLGSTERLDGSYPPPPLHPKADP
jgi:hypothetical protein